MDDIMILMNKVIIDLQGFDESQFGIFDDAELTDLMRIWQDYAERNPNRFIAYLSPDQKQKMALWAAERTSYSIDELIGALERFVKFLKKSSSKRYPKPEKRKKNGRKLSS